MTLDERDLTEPLESQWQTYPEYKDSEIEWIGDIPIHWEIWKLSHAFGEIGSGTTPDTSNENYYVGSIYWVTTSELREKTINDTVKKVSIDAIRDNSTLKIYPPGTLLIAMYGATIGRIGILGVEACTNQACCALADPKTLGTKFTFYWLIGFRDEIIRLSSGGGQPNINQEKVRSIRIPAPSLDEQHAIAIFLDRETARIDALIAKKEALITLLQEQRQAIISHAVTKGLNPDAPMKDSGIEWLGEIPAHWEVKRLKHISPRLSVGLVINPSNYVDEEGTIPFIYGADVSEGRISIENARRIMPESNQLLSASYLNFDDLVTVRVGYPGVTAVVPRELDGINCASIMITRKHHTFVSQWLCYAMNSKIGKYNVELVEYGAAQKQFNISHAVEFIFAVPPKYEQERIVDYLDYETHEIANLIHRTSHTIQLLQEYRTALISAAVTGKIDVREEV